MLSHVIHQLAVTATLFAVFGAASSAFAQEPEPVSTHVELVSDTLPKDTRAAVELELDKQLAAAVTELDLVSAESESAELVLRVEIGQPNRKSPIYVVHAVALHDGQVLQRGDAQTCLRCTPTELVRTGLGILPSATARALAARPEPVAAQAPAPALIEPPGQPAPQLSPPGPATYLGVTLGTLGLIGAVTGGVLLDRDGAGSNATGIALLSAGLTSMVSGTALLLIDVWVLAPQRANRPPRIELSYAGLRF